MRFMIIVRSVPAFEADPTPAPDPDLLAAMLAYHDELARAGVLLDGAGLHPSRAGWRVHYGPGGRHIADGPFAETKELIAGYTLIQVRSREEARAWASRFPAPFIGITCEIEVRRLYEEADFGPGGDMEIGR